MREAREPSVNAAAMFARCAAAQYSMSLKSLAIQNLYTLHDTSCGNIFLMSKLQEVTFLNSTGGIGDDGGTGML